MGEIVLCAVAILSKYANAKGRNIGGGRYTQTIYTTDLIVGVEWDREVGPTT
jgi:hypothetical protein